MEIFLRYFLPLYFILFFGFAFLWRSYKVWKQNGVNPYKLGNADTAHDYNGKMFRLILLACILVVIMYAFVPSLYPYLLPVSWISQTFVVWTGIILLSMAMIWVLLAQSHMQRSWRIGIDETIKTDLIQRGLFAISRNPIFLGMRVMLLGFFLVLPNAITLSILLIGEILIQIQVRLEEEYLQKIHGQFYLAYQQKVHRWL